MLGESGCREPNAGSDANSGTNSDARAGRADANPGSDAGTNADPSTNSDALRCPMRLT